MNRPADGDGPQTMVFCDFDGTITEQDTFLSTCQRFAPDAAEHLCPAIGEGIISLREGLQQLVGALPSGLAAEITEHVRGHALRRGFGEFLHQLQEWDIPVIVLSSSPEFSVAARLAPWRHLITAVHALQVDLRGAYMQACVTGSNPDEAVPKAEIMLGYPAHTRIVIGDSISDQQMALHADEVFARDRLLAYMHAQARPVTAYRDFHDVLDALRDRGAVACAH